MAKKKADQLNEKEIGFYQDRPIEFVEDLVLCLTPAEVEANQPMRRLEPESKEILLSIRDNRFTSAHSGRGVTKTFSFAMAIIWWIFCWENARVFATGPKYDQLKATLWAEVQKWLQKACYYIINELQWSSEKIYHKSSPGTWFGQIFTASDKVNIAGVHEEHLLILIDEASGVPDDIYEHLLGCMTRPHNKMVIAGNPTAVNGFHYDSYNRNRDLWNVLHFNSEECALVDKRFIEEFTRRYPRDHDMFRVHILGLPPKGNPRAVIQLAEAEAARTTKRTIDPGKFLEMSIDPAREGDDLTTIGIRQGNKVLEIKGYPKTKAPEVCTFTLEMLRQYRTKTGIQSKIKIKVDTSNDYGRGIVDYLVLNEKDNIDVVGCPFGGAGNDIYGDYATIMWFGLRDVITTIELPDDDDLMEELSGRLWNTVGGRMKIERKDEYKKRLRRSPDKADCCVMLFAEGAKKVFQTPDEASAKEFEIDWYHKRTFDSGFDGCLMIDVVHLVALTLTKDLTLCGLGAVFELYRNVLWIYKEYYQDTPIADELAPKIKMFSMKCQEEHKPRIIGNELMFRKDGDRRPMSELFVGQQIHILEPTRYDEFGAIGLGSQMFKAGKIVTHVEAVRARKQTTLWSIKANKVDDSEFGFCKCLLLILSEVRQQIKPIENMRMPKDYSSVKPQSQPTERRAAWMSR